MAPRWWRGCGRTAPEAWQARDTLRAVNARAGLLFLLFLAYGFLSPASADAAQGSLGDIDTLQSPAGRHSGEPCLAVAPDGTVWMSWLEPLSERTSDVPRKNSRTAPMTSRLIAGKWPRA